MADITPAMVGKLREMTGAGLMACKNALVASNGDLDGAVDILRKQGVASAEKKAGRSANEGVIAQFVAPGGKAGVLIEVNCETDFVAKNESFVAFCSELAKKVATDANADLEADRVAAVARIGENIRITRHHRLGVTGNGLIAAYIHTGGKVGVLVEVGAGKEATTTSEEFKQLVRDITLQIAAAHPTAVTREQVPAAVIDKEREIAAQSDRLKGKPPQALEKILAGMLDKFFQTVCLVEQGFVKRNGEVTVKEHVAEVAKKLGDELTVRSFVRFQVGETATA
ncbi:MAG: translation elongation factor Ts [Verrucomicrobia bacterium]|nr:translation elongation factor Ts [Verrucomicrobiota bacterium]